MTKANAPLGAAAKSMAMFLQDPSLPELYEDHHFPLDSDFLNGTSSSKFAVQDSDEWGYPLFLAPDWGAQADLSFEYFAGSGLVDNPQFHQVNVFAVLDHTMRAVEEEIGHEIDWNAGYPLIVRPHAFEGGNAYYDPYEHSLNFGYFTSPFRRAPVWTCLSHDVIAHELGHAILDNFRPLLYFSHLDTGAFHESFGDLLTLFSALGHPSVVEHLYRETGGDMMHPSLITRLSEEFGTGLHGVGVPYLRSALEGPNYDIVSDDTMGIEFEWPHARSTIWTAAIYEIVAQLVTLTHPDGFADTDVGMADFVAALTGSVRWVKGMLVRTLHYLPPTDVTLPMMARLMIAADTHVFGDDDNFRMVAREVFVRRKLWDEKLDLIPPDVGDDFRQVAGQDSSRVARVVMQHADALGIPRSEHANLSTPKLFTTTRQIDRVTQDGVAIPVSVTQHYLEYAYDQIVLETDRDSGEKYPMYYSGGGTLVMDDNWKPLILSTYPERREDDPSEPGNTQYALRRARRSMADVRRLSTFVPRPQDASPAGSDHAHRPYSIQAPNNGAYRLTRRNMKDSWGSSR